MMTWSLLLPLLPTRPAVVVAAAEAEEEEEPKVLMLAWSTAWHTMCCQKGLMMTMLQVRGIHYCHWYGDDVETQMVMMLQVKDFDFVPNLGFDFCSCSNAGWIDFGFCHHYYYCWLNDEKMMTVVNVDCCCCCCHYFAYWIGDVLMKTYPHFHYETTMIATLVTNLFIKCGLR